MTDKIEDYGYILSYSYLSIDDKEVSGKVTVRADCLSMAFSKLVRSLMIGANCKSSLKIEHLGFEVFFNGSDAKASEVYFKPENRND